MRDTKTKNSPKAPIRLHAGHSIIFPANVSGAEGVEPVIIVKMSEVAMPTWSPVPKATTASADAASNAVNKKHHPVNRQRNINPFL